MGAKAVAPPSSLYLGGESNTTPSNKGVISKETVVLRRWGRETQSFGFIRANRSDEGLTLETSAFNFFAVANLPYQLS